MATRGRASSWRWSCDRDGCTTHTDPVPKHALPKPEQMQEDGWFIAKLWGDRCPACVAAGQVPDVPAWGAP